jgi:uncharacterized membrane protein
MDDFNILLAATLVFVGGHFLLSSHGPRRRLVERLGENGHRGVYTVVALASFIAMLFAYGRAPYVEIWPEVAVLRWLVAALMLLAFLLVVCGLTTKSPTSVGGEDLAGEREPAPGILRVTRHPFLWGVSLWAASHLLVNGDLASIIVIGGMLVLALGGMHHIDRRREAALGAAWGPLRMTTSLLPFAALASGRTTMDWKGIGWWRPALALVVYLGFFHAHELIIGLSALP